MVLFITVFCFTDYDVDGNQLVQITFVREYNGRFKVLKSNLTNQTMAGLSVQDYICDSMS
jgi:hypothetical protein